MDIIEAQKDSRRAYVGGGPGVVISGLVWASAGIAQALMGTQIGFDVLFVGGMMIFPLSILVVRSFLRRAKPRPENTLGWAALESTVAMIGGLFAAWLFVPVRSGFVFPLSAIAVGTHYAVFRTVYGDRLFVFLGALMTCAGLFVLYVKPLEDTGMIFAVAVIELVFGAILTLRALGHGGGE